MSTTDLVTQAILAATASLQAGMPAQVAAFNADPLNPTDIDVPQTYHFGGEFELANFAWPQVEVAVGDGRLQNFPTGNVGADHFPSCGVAIWLEGETGEIKTLYQQVLGLRHCALQILTKTGAFGAGVQIDRVRGVFWRADVVPADPQNRDFERWRTPLFLQFALETVETFG